MAENKQETASFVLRLSQKIFKNEEGDPQIQWRGNIRHVQSDDEARFTTFENAAEFVQKKLSELTLKAIEDKPEEEQKGIISKSFDFWKKVATVTPKIVLDSIKDPKKQATHLQEQIQEQIHQFSEKIEDRIGQKLELDDILGSSKSDSRKILQLLGDMAEQIEKLNQKVDALSKQNKVRVK